jgi:hypothetical protein
VRGADDGYDLETLAPIEDSLPQRTRPRRKVSFHLSRRWVAVAAVLLGVGVIVGVSIWRHGARDPQNGDAELLTTPSTIGTETLVRRCETISARVAPRNSGIGTSPLDAANARQALERAHEPIPAWLATLDDTEELAECLFSAASQSAGPMPTIVCPNGDIIAVGPSRPPTMYAVDVHLDTVRLPGIQYLRPVGGPTVPKPGPWVGLDTPSRAP